MDKELIKKVKKFAAGVIENPDDISIFESGDSLVIPQTTAGGGVSSGKDKGRNDSTGDGGDGGYGGRLNGG